MPLRGQFLHDSFVSPERVTGLDAREQISEISDIRVEISSQDPDLDLEAFLWTQGAVQIFETRAYQSDPSTGRFFHGTIEEARYLGPVGQQHRYSFRLRPPVNGLSYRKRSRIFQDKSFVDVVKAVFQDAGLPESSFDWSGVGEYPPSEYITQWRESELAFVRRLLEENGVFFWLDHSQAELRMLLGDTNNVFLPLDVGPISIGEPGTVRAEDTLHLAWNVTFEAAFSSDRHYSGDWNWLVPHRSMKGEFAAGGDKGLEVYEFPGNFGNEAMAGTLAENRLQAAMVERQVLRGETTCLYFAPSRVFSLQETAPLAATQDYILLATHHRFRDSALVDSALVDGNEAEPSELRVAFDAIPSRTPFRPARVTPVPRILGKESAVVTGPAGEEIHVDENGRIKAHFYWDREGAIDDTSSCWLRVQQQNTPDQMLLPRVGWEVDVGFLFGDPNRPLAMQKLYNEETLPPYELPANLMQSSLQTSSTPGGGGTNEIRMNDGGGAMEFFVHAQKDMTTDVSNDMSEDIGVDSSYDVGTDASTSVGADESVSIGGNQSLSVVGRIVIQQAGAESVTVSATDEWGVTASHTIDVGGGRTDDIGGLKNVLCNRANETFNGSASTSVGGAYSLVAGGSISEAVGGDKTELVGGAKAEIISKTKAENVGIGKILTSGLNDLKAGGDIQSAAEAAMAITVGGPMAVKCGGDFTLSGSSVSVIIGTLKMQVGGSKLTANGGSVKVKAPKIGGDGPAFKLSGTIKYK